MRMLAGNTKRRLTVAIILPCLLTGLVLYGYFIEPAQLQIRQITVTNKTLATVFKGKKIILLSDLHIGKTLPAAAPKALHAIKRIQPDMIFLAGDTVSWDSTKESFHNTIQFFEALETTAPVFAVRGDTEKSSTSRYACQLCHLGPDYKTQRLRPIFLNDSGQTAGAGNSRVFVYGVDYNEDASAATSLNSLLPEDMPAIVLSHNPDIFPLIGASRDVLVLAGDTHGGQVWLPDPIKNFVYALYDKTVPLIHGLKKEGRKTLYVTSGIGVSGLPIRIGVPPELAVLEFEE